jgi:peptide/nickel transport system substrate-binding protein
MIAQLEAGAIDVADAPPLADSVRLGNDPNYQIFTVASGTNVIGLNTSMPPTDNKLLRQALNWAIDRERIVQTVYLGTVTSECLPWESNSLAYDASKNHFYTYDPEKAKSLVAQSGVTNLALDLTVSAGSAQTDALAQLYQASLSDLGITLTIKPYQSATYLDQINNHKYQGAYIGGIAYASMEPVTRMANSRHLDPSGNSNTAFTSDQYVQLFNSASAEPDATKRKQLYDQINDLLLDESFVMPISNGPGRMLTRAKVHDIAPSQHGTFLFNSAWLDS